MYLEDGNVYRMVLKNKTATILKKPFVISPQYWYELFKLPVCKEKKNLLNKLNVVPNG